MTLEVQVNCSSVGTCIFQLTDDDMENLAIALHHLESLRLGKSRIFDTCKTTVAALMPISVHCMDLTVLETHFNTLEIVRDLQRVLDRGAGRDDAKCRVSNLPVGGLSVEAQKNIETVVMGLKVILPCLRNLVNRWSILVGCMKQWIDGATLTSPLSLDSSASPFLFT